MGYSTQFWGRINFNQPVDVETKKLLDGLNNTRRMKRNVEPEYGIEGEFYITGAGFRGEDKEPNITDYNSPPSTQPSLWCQWRLTEDNQGLEWVCAKKFHYDIEWLVYLRDVICNPRGITFQDGRIDWQGEDYDDFGYVEAGHNVLKIYDGEQEYNFVGER